jgi:hypothetical protein
MSDSKPNFLRDESSTSLTSTPVLLTLLASAPLFWAGRYGVGLASIAVGLLLALCKAANQLQLKDKQEIRYNIMEPEDVLLDMMQWEERMNAVLQEKDSGGDDYKGVSRDRLRVVLLKGLAALAKKYGRRRQTANREKKADGDGGGTGDGDQMPLICQEAAYVGMRSFPADDAIVSASLSLLALVAKSREVRERHLYQADLYGLDRPISCMVDALQRAKDDDDPDTDKEQDSAELQRRGCLLLGALSDGDADMAHQIVQEGGLDAILQAIMWYRFHEEVANWALWAIFILCYENRANKAAVVSSRGVPVVIQTMRHCPDSQEVARHGVALLFDLLRESGDDGGPAIDVWRIRNAALAAGLHEVVVNAMQAFSDSMDIMMMGQEILVGTDYQGPIPQPQLGA